MSASFHAQRLGLCSPRSYAGYNEYDFEFFVTKDGEVYRHRKAFFGLGSDLFYFQYSGKTKNEVGFFEGSPVEGDAAATIRKNSVGTWSDKAAAKAEADKIASAAPTPGNVTTPGGDTVPIPTKPPEPPKTPAKDIPWVPIALTGVAAVGLITVFVVATRENQ